MKKVLATFLAFTLIGFNGFMLLEGGVVSATTSTDEFTVTVDVTGEISIACPATEALTPNIPGLTGGTANGDVTCTVITSQSSGYNLWLKASTSPAMVSGSDNFADYTQAISTSTDYTWSVANNAAEFGFTVATTTGDTSADLDFRNDGAANCGTGSVVDGTHCWRGLSTTDYLLASSGDETPVGGDSTQFNFRAEVGSAKNQPTGSYSATVIATAAVL